MRRVDVYFVLFLKSHEHWPIKSRNFPRVNSNREELRMRAKKVGEVINNEHMPTLNDDRHVLHSRSVMYHMITDKWKWKSLW